MLLKAESRPLDACAEGRQRRLVMISIECRRLFLKTANPELPSLISALPELAVPWLRFGIPGLWRESQHPFFIPVHPLARACLPRLAG